jgi:fatty acid desaturase
LDARIADLERRIAALDRTAKEVQRTVRRRVRITAEEEDRRRRRKQTVKAIVRIGIWTAAFLASAGLIWWIILLLAPGNAPRP